jgi:hypothetical protein
VTIDRAIISVSAIGFAKECDGDQSLHTPQRVVIDLLTAEITPTLAALKGDAGDYCSLRARFSIVGSSDDAIAVDGRLQGHSVLVDGTRADGTPFTVRAAFDDEFTLLGTDEKITLGEREDFVIGFAMNEWFATDLDAATVEDGAISISASANPALLQNFLYRVTASTRLFDDDDADGRLDAGEADGARALGVPVGALAAQPPNADPNVEPNGTANNANNTPIVPTTNEETAACVIADSGVTRTVTAVADLADNPPHAAFLDTRVEVQLVDLGGEYGGFVRFPREDTADWAFFLSADVPFNILDEDGDEESLSDQEVEGGCPNEVVVGHDVDLDAGDYFLEFGPTDQPTVSFIYVED